MSFLTLKLTLTQQGTSDLKRFFEFRRDSIFDFRVLEDDLAK
jgi:hypothetical protein